MTKEEKCKLLDSLYSHINPHFHYDALMKHNESQIDTLLSACKNEDGTYRTDTTRK